MFILSDITIFIGFILTMWYVNLALSMSLTASTSRFILTMWYVNFKEQYKAWSKEQSFILTMWYVNRYDGNSKTS